MSSIIMNSLRRCRDSASLLREAGGVELFLGYRKTSNEVLKVVASCIVAFGASQAQMQTLEDMDNVVDFMSQSLIGAHASDRRRYRGFALEEVLDGISSMAARGMIGPPFLLREGVMSVLTSVLTQPKDQTELENVTELLWTFSFDEDSKHLFSGAAELVPNLKKIYLSCQEYPEDKNPKVKKNIEGFLWNLEGKRPHSAEKNKSKKKERERRSRSISSSKTIPTSLSSNSYVMISYDWGKKDLVLAFNQSIKATGLSTWIDVEQMSGSTLDAMAVAVEGAAVVLICVSERYKESPNCRAEAEYAFQLGKPIIPVRMQAAFKADGWLGIIMGTKLYFDCHDREHVQNATERITAEIAKHVSANLSSQLEKANTASDSNSSLNSYSMAIQLFIASLTSLTFQK